EVRLLDDYGRVAGDLDERGLGDGDDRRATGHRLENGQAEPLVPRRLDEARGALEELHELGLLDVAAHGCAARAELGREGRILLGPGDDERQTGRAGRIEGRELVLARLDRAD